jgi:hypothetical protein
MRRKHELQMFFNCSDLCRRIHGSMINLNLPQADAWAIVRKFLRLTRKK